MAPLTTLGHRPPGEEWTRLRRGGWVGRRADRSQAPGEPPCAYSTCRSSSPPGASRELGRGVREGGGSSESKLPDRSDECCGIGLPPVVSCRPGRTRCSIQADPTGGRLAWRATSQGTSVRSSSWPVGKGACWRRSASSSPSSAGSTSLRIRARRCSRVAINPTSSSVTLAAPVVDFFARGEVQLVERGPRNTWQIKVRRFSAAHSSARGRPSGRSAPPPLVARRLTVARLRNIWRALFKEIVDDELGKLVGVARWRGRREPAATRRPDAPVGGLPRVLARAWKIRLASDHRSVCPERASGN
jgi:hypothetical protein